MSNTDQKREDDVLRRMLVTKPEVHKAEPKRKEEARLKIVYILSLLFLLLFSLWSLFRSLKSGTTRWLDTIEREDNPAAYWTVLGYHVFLAIMSCLLLPLIWQA